MRASLFCHSLCERKHPFFVTAGVKSRRQQRIKCQASAFEEEREKGMKTFIFQKEEGLKASSESNGRVDSDCIRTLLLAP